MKHPQSSRLDFDSWPSHAN